MGRVNVKQQVDQEAQRLLMRRVRVASFVPTVALGPLAKRVIAQLPLAPKLIA